MRILAIETSCDETSASVVQIARADFEILSNIVSSQVKVHAKYGGIVPEVAARLHIEKILPVIEMALAEAERKNGKTEERKNGRTNFDYIAVCAGPGLMSSLLVGVETAKTLAWVYNKPLIKINHLEGHLLSAESTKHKAQNFRQRRTKQIKNSKLKIQNQLNLSPNKLPATSYNLKFPAVGLIVSGGHTQIVLMKDYLKYKIIGQTRDDAAGEAFDKAAKILGLGYPGGPAISKEAGKKQNSKFKINLPRPMIDSNDFDFSFSGLKTAILYKWQDLQKKLSALELKKARRQMAFEVQRAIVEVLVRKTIQAAEKFNVKTIIIGGGVSANKLLQLEMAKAVADFLPSVKFLYPELAMTGDNAAMIGIAAYYHAKNKNFVDPMKLKADANWALTEKRKNRAFVKAKKTTAGRRKMKKLKTKKRKN